MTNFEVTSWYLEVIKDSLKIINEQTKYIPVWYLHPDGSISKENKEGSISTPTFIQLGEFAEAQYDIADPNPLALFGINIAKTSYIYPDATFYELCLISLAFSIHYSETTLNENREESNIIREDPFSINP